MPERWRLRSFLAGMARTFGITGAPTVSEEKLAGLFEHRGRKAFRVAPSAEMPLDPRLLTPDPALMHSPEGDLKGLAELRAEATREATND